MKYRFSVVVLSILVLFCAYFLVKFGINQSKLKNHSEINFKIEPQKLDKQSAEIEKQKPTDTELLMTRKAKEKAQLKKDILSHMINNNDSSFEHQQMAQNLYEINLKRTGVSEEMTRLEKEALDLLDENSTDKERLKVYESVAFMYANNGMNQPYKVIEYCEKALKHPVDELKACQLYVYWGEALERKTVKNNGIDTYVREDIAVPYLNGLNIVASRQIEHEKQNIPAVGRYQYHGSKEDPEYQRLLEKHAEEIAVRQYVMFQNKLIEYRKILIDKCVSLYAQGPDEVEELKKIADEIIKDADLISEIIIAIQIKRKQLNNKQLNKEGK